MAAMKTRTHRSFAIKPLVLGLVGVALLNLVWWMLGRFASFDLQLFPPFTEIFPRAARLITDGEFWRNSMNPSLSRLAIATVVSIPLALLSGLLIGRFETPRMIAMPLVDFIYPLPKVAIFPLVLAIFGLGPLSKIALIAIGMFFPFFLNVVGGVTRISFSPLQDLLATYRPSTGKTLWLFYFKGLSTDFLTGLRTSLGYGFTLVVVSETTASNDGIGHFLWRSWESFDLLNLHAGLLILCCTGWIVQAALGRLAHDHFTDDGTISKSNSVKSP